MWFYIVQGCLLGLLCLFLIIYYSHHSTPIYARLLVFLSFLVSFLCFCLLPIDIYEQAMDSDLTPQISTSWTVIYYINFFACWLILPFAQEYQDSGYNTFKGKLKDAFIMNGILIGAILLGATCILVYLVISGKFQFSQLPSIFATLVNLFGLLLVSIFLGYGLVSFPKQFNLKRDYKRRVRHCHQQAERINTRKQEILEEIYEVREILSHHHKTNTDQTPQLLTLIKETFQLENFRYYGQSRPELEDKKLHELNKVVKKRILEFNAGQDELDDLVDELTSITQSFSHNNYFRKKIIFSVLFFLTTIMSVLIFLAEVATFISPLQVINVLRYLDFSSPASYFLNCSLMLYITYITVHTVFQIKLYKIFALHPHHSGASSLFFTTINLARICYPLCYNYQQITNYPSSSFLEFFGEVNLDKQIAFLFPIIMVLLGLFNLFDFYDTILGYLGLGSYAFDHEETEEKAEEGRRILIERLKERNIQNSNMEMIQLL